MRFVYGLCVTVLVACLSYPACTSPSTGEEQPGVEQSQEGQAVSESVGSNDSGGATETQSSDSQSTPEPGPEATAPDGVITRGDTHKISIDPRGYAASILLSADEFKAWNERKGFQVSTARQEFTKHIYKVFKDNFDFIFFVMNNKTRPSVLPFGQLVKVSNAVKGLGMKVYSNASKYGSGGKLKAVMQLSRKDYILLGPSLHELMHNWGNFILDTKLLDAQGKEANAKPHWGISDVGGQLGGFDATTFKDNVDGDPKKYRGNMPGKKNFGFGSNGGNGQPYSNFELYLMGVIPKSEVKPIRIFTGISAVRDEFIKNGSFSADSLTTYTIDQIVGAPLNKGEREPGVDKSQKKFRVLAIMLTTSPLTPKEWDDFTSQIKQFSFSGKDSSRLYNFWEATGGRASLDMGDLHRDLKD